MSFNVGDKIEFLHSTTVKGLFPVSRARTVNGYKYGTIKSINEDGTYDIYDSLNKVYTNINLEIIRPKPHGVLTGVMEEYKRNNIFSNLSSYWHGEQKHGLSDNNIGVNDIIEIDDINTDFVIENPERKTYAIIIGKNDIDKSYYVILQNGIQQSVKIKNILRIIKKPETGEMFGTSPSNGIFKYIGKDNKWNRINIFEDPIKYPIKYKKINFTIEDINEDKIKELNIDPENIKNFYENEEICITPVDAANLDDKNESQYRKYIKYPQQYYKEWNTIYGGKKKIKRKGTKKIRKTLNKKYKVRKTTRK